jgi:hypothetical protein
MSKISELSDGGALQSTDYLIAVRSGGNVKVQANGAVSGTTGQFSTSLNVDGTVTADGLTVDGSLATINSSGPNVDLVLTEGSTNTDARIRNSNGILEIDADLNNEFGNSSIVFAVDGTDKLKINNNGDISFYEDTGTTPKFFWDASAEALGIGTTSPGESLETNGNIQIKYFGTNVDPSGARYLIFNNTDDTLVVGQPLGGLSWVNNDASATAGEAAYVKAYCAVNTGSAELRFGTGAQNGASEAMRIDGSGNVGIGTTSPSTTLAIGSNATGGYNGGVLLNRGASTYNFYEASDGTNSVIFGLDNSISNAKIGTVNSYPVGFYTANAERMRIDSSGNVGIGTSSPARQLHVKDGSSYGYARVEGASGGFGGVLELVSNSVGSGTDFAGALDFYMTPSNHIGRIRVQRQSGAADSGDMLFYTANAGSLSEKMRIDSSGNLLVGCTSLPSASVKGSAFLNDANQGRLYVASNNTGAQDLAYWINPNGVVGTITTNGSSTAYNTSSDYRLKDIDGPITNSGAYIDALRPVQGSWKADGSRFIGLIAHEVQEVSETPIATGEKDGEEMQAMDYSAPELIANLIAEIQSLRARVAQLEGA